MYLKYIGNFEAPELQEPPDTRTREEIEAERIACECREKTRAANRNYARRKREEQRAAKAAAM
ncbi:hypothetical protein FACS1894202_13050 [Clostridia bacterium]|nr:hypothetical protein FACS1894202_13050 [Clostridia bacterium]